MSKNLKKTLITVLAIGLSGSILAACGNKKAPQKSKAPAVAKHAKKPAATSMNKMPTSLQHIYKSLSKKPNVRESIGGQQIDIVHILHHHKMKTFTMGINHISKRGNAYDIVGDAKGKTAKISIVKQKGDLVKFNQNPFHLSFTGSKTTATHVVPKKYRIKGNAKSIKRSTKKMNKKLKKARKAAKGNRQGKRQNATNLQKKTAKKGKK